MSEIEADEAPLSAAGLRSWICSSLCWLLPLEVWSDNICWRCCWSRMVTCTIWFLLHFHSCEWMCDTQSHTRLFFIHFKVHIPCFIIHSNSNEPQPKLTFVGQNGISYSQRGLVVIDKSPNGFSVCPKITGLSFGHVRKNSRRAYSDQGYHTKIPPSKK